ncbi:MAG: hypothetical protein H0X24_14325 [Ktedonobacterales bacterium]|nr:hypothetical protein [Ktedonobacterales bacterium]
MSPSMKQRRMHTIAAHSLAELLTQGRDAVERAAQQHATQRGATHSLNRVALTWLAPQTWDADHLRWTAADIAWYLRVFVSAPTGAPIADDPPLLFPYTYATRARAWDGGWGSLAELLAALPTLSFTLPEARRDQGAFTHMVLELAERLHLQTVLSLLLLYPPTVFAAFVAQPDLATAMAAHWHQDLLASAISDIGANPHSRRAVVGPLGYPQLEAQLQPQMGKPPYQLFQFLPDDANAPLSSIHEHRSLDVGGGAPLDFAHDHQWLSTACAALGRTMGDITLVAHNLHAYPAAPTDESITAWLCRVTDGYPAGADIPAQLIAQPDYAANLARAWAQWHAE